MQFTSYDFLPGQVTQTSPEVPSSSIKWDDDPFLRGLSEMVCDKCLLPRPGPGQALLKNVHYYVFLLERTPASNYLREQESGKLSPWSEPSGIQCTISREEVFEK